MFAPLNGAPLNGGAAGLWVSATAESSAVAGATAVRVVKPTGTLEAQASEQFDSTRLAKPATTSLVVASTSSGVGERHAYFGGVAEARADSTVEVYGFAYVQSSPDAYADSTASANRTAWQFGELLADATFDLAAYRLVWRDGGELVAEAEEQGTGVRLAGMSAETAAVDAGLSITATRLANMATESVANVAESSASAERQVVPTSTLSATAEAPDVGALRTARPDVRAARARGISWIDEGRIERLRVRQIAATGSIIARGRTRGIANEWLGRGVTTSTADITLDRLWFVRSGRGAIEASAELAVDSNRIQILTGGALGRAVMVASPTITRGGVRYSYFDAVAEAVGEEHADALRITAANASVLETQIAGEANSYLRHGMSGYSTAQSSTLGDSYVNPWTFATGLAEVTAQSTGEFIRYRWVGTSGVTDAMAGGSGDATRYRWVGVTGELHPQAAVVDAAYVAVGVSGVAYAWAESALDKRHSLNGMAGEAVTTGETTSAFTVFTIHYPTAEAAVEAWTQADGLRTVHVYETPLLFGNASVMRAVPRINPGAPAPATRTVILAANPREILLPASNREYRVA
ncbi:hypothetical protein [Vreelandella massiliensis]|uniref:hypothetical protein n=1 Tax=Vreelandella massiliensis TaxID=1816686 RepID=UPI00096AAEF6|nr:hypothetical protein [Halomonas massiliensis]